MSDEQIILRHWQKPTRCEHTEHDDVGEAIVCRADGIKRHIREGWEDLEDPEKPGEFTRRLIARTVGIYCPDHDPAPADGDVVETLEYIRADETQEN